MNKLQKYKHIKKIIFLIVLCSPIHLSAQNLIQNPGFEDSLNNWWYSSDIPSATQFIIDHSEMHTGSSCLLIETQDSSNTTAFIAQIVNVVAGHKYMFEYWVKSQNIEKYMLPFVKFRNDTTGVFDSYFCPSGNQSDWLSIKSRFTAPDSADNMVIFFGLFGQGKLWLDDFMLVELTDTSYNNFTVNINQTSQDFKKMFSANGYGPGPASQEYNHILKFQELGIDYVRTHDYQIAFDYHAIFPDTSKNPFDSTAYCFHTTDSCIANIINAGGKVFFRFGESYEISPVYNIPPADMDKWAQVCVQIIKHYNDGWNNGFYYDLHYFEIWNEPDLKDFWNGSVEEYCRLYRKTARKIKQYDSSIKVGGPTISNIFDESFINIFIDSIVTYNIPLDFFSYHFYYHPNPYYFKYANEYVRQKLNAAGLTDIPLINSEWNSYMISFDTFSEWGMDDPLSAASLVSAMTYMQESTIENFFRYSFINYWFGMVSYDDDSWRYSGLAMRAFHNLTFNNQRIEATASDSLGTTIIASKSISGDQVQILISDNSSNAYGYNLTLQEIESGYIYNYRIYRIDNDNKYFITKTGTLSELNPGINLNVKSPFADHIILNKTVNICPNKLNNTFLIYPNPCKDYINIKIFNIERRYWKHIKIIIKK